MRINEIPAYKVQNAYKKACRTQKDEDIDTWGYLSRKRSELIEEQRKKRHRVTA